MVSKYGKYGMHKSIKGEFKTNLDDGPGPLQSSLSSQFSLFSLYNYG